MAVSLQQLIIRTMPTTIVFHDGVAKDKIIGFEGLTDGLPEGREDEWSTITLSKLLVEKQALNRDNVVDEENQVLELQEKMANMRRAVMGNFGDDDFDLDD